MFRRFCCLMVATTMLIGCRKDAAPPPAQVANAELGVVPVQPGTPDTSLLGSAASGEEPAKPSAAATPAAAPIDDSTPDGLAQAYATVMSNLQLAQLPAMVIPDQQAQANALVEATQPLITAMAELNKAVKAKLPNENLRLTPAGLSSMAAPITVASVETDPSDPNAATATFQAEGRPEPMKRTLKKVDEHWRVDEPNLPPADALAQMGPVFQKDAEALKSLAGRIESGELADAATVMSEYQKAMKQTPGGAPPQEPGGAAPAPPTAAPPKPARPGPVPPPATPNAAAPKQKSELEQDTDNAFSGPGHLRRR